MSFRICALSEIGETAFSGGAARVMFAQIQQPAPDPRNTNPDIPDTLAEAILKATGKDTDDRFNSINEFPVFLSE